MLQIQLFGPLALHVDGTAYPMRRLTDSLRLLAFLLLHRNRPLPRATLAYRLWLDRPEDQARGALRRYLYRLNHDLPAAAAPWVLASNSEVQWNPAADARIDVAEFDRHFQAAMAALGGANAHSAELDLGKLIALYSDPLLADFADEWVTTERAEYERQFIDALDQLANLHAARGDVGPALVLAHRLLDFDRYRETTHRLLIKLHYAAGDRSAALRQYELCEKMLRDELDLSPEAPTREILDFIRAGLPVEDLAFRGSLRHSIEIRLPMNLQPAPTPEPALERLHKDDSTPAGADLVPNGAEPVPPSWATPLSSFVGRRHEIGALLRLLSAHRLVTISGPGGSGKTRLAIELAREARSCFPDGVRYAALADVTSSDLLPSAVADALDLPEAATGTTRDRLIRYLRPRRLLLVMDNCEHLRDSCTMLAEAMLGAASGLHIIATSRVSLEVPGEIAWPLAPLSLPANAASDSPVTAELAQESEAVQLFLDRFSNLHPNYHLNPHELAIVASVCSRLDGLPLAVELAAARTRHISLRELFDLLGSGLDVLAGRSPAAPARQKTVRATIEWSVRLLSPVERDLFITLGAFADPFTLDAVESVWGAAQADAASEAGGQSAMDTLAGLVDHSLVQRDTNEGCAAAYRMLSVLKAYAREGLERRGDAARVRGKHLAHYLAMAEAESPRIQGPEQISALNRLEEQNANLCAAIEWAIGLANAGLAMRFVAALWPFWSMHGHVTVGRRYLSRVLGMPDLPDDALLQAKVRNGAGALAFIQGDHDKAQQHYETALLQVRRLGDRRRIATALTNLSGVLRRTGDLQRARDLALESLAIQRGLDNSMGVSTALNALALSCIRLGECHQARAYLLEGLSIEEDLGRGSHISAIFNNLGLVAETEGDHVGASQFYNQSLHLERQIGSLQGQAIALDNLGAIERQSGNIMRSRDLHRQSLSLYREINDRSGEVDAILHLAWVAFQEGDLASAQVLVGQSLNAYHELGESRGVADALLLCALLHASEGNPRPAAMLLGAEDKLRATLLLTTRSGEEALRQACLADLRVGLGEAEHCRAFAHGQALEWEAAMIMITMDSLSGSLPVAYSGETEQ